MAVEARFNKKQADAIAGFINSLAGVPSRAAPQAARAIRRLITRQFNTGTDPFGRGWAPLAASTIARGRRAPPLTDTRRMRRGIRVNLLRPSGIGITVPDPPSRFHQFGTRKMPRRAILPLRATLPKSWAAAIERAVRDEFGGG